MGGGEAIFVLPIPSFVEFLSILSPFPLYEQLLGW